MVDEPNEDEPALENHNDSGTGNDFRTRAQFIVQEALTPALMTNRMTNRGQAPRTSAVVTIPNDPAAAPHRFYNANGQAVATVSANNNGTTLNVSDTEAHVVVHTNTGRVTISGQGYSHTMQLPTFAGQNVGALTIIGVSPGTIALSGSGQYLQSVASKKTAQDTAIPLTPPQPTASMTNALEQVAALGGNVSLPILGDSGHRLV